MEFLRQFSLCDAALARLVEVNFVNKSKKNSLSGGPKLHRPPSIIPFGCCLAFTDSILFLDLLLQDEGVCRLDAFVVLLLGLDDVEAEVLVELDGTLVVDLKCSNRLCGAAAGATNLWL